MLPTPCVFRLRHLVPCIAPRISRCTPFQALAALPAAAAACATRSAAHTFACPCSLADLWEMAVERYADNDCLGVRTVAPDGTPGHYEWTTYAEARFSRGFSSRTLRSLSAQPRKERMEGSVKKGTRR